MTIAQLKYIIAVSECGNFMKAAEFCHVTQPTLSIQIKKIEEYFDSQIFDRTKKPLRLTPIGELVIEQAKIGLLEIDRIHKIIKQSKHDIPSTLTIGVIPTLCPYLVPLFFNPLSKRYPDIKIFIKEITTDKILKGLESGSIDIGLLIKPEKLQRSLFHTPIFNEPLLGYISETHALFRKRHLMPKDINEKEFWLLEDCHCFHNQVINLCEKVKIIHNQSTDSNYRVGGIETARRLVELQGGFTLLPQLATIDFNEKQISRLRSFHHPMPAREVSIVCNKNHFYEDVNASLISIIKSQLPDCINDEVKENVKILELN